MVKKGFKGRCEKERLSKCKDVCRTFNAIQKAYAHQLEQDNDVISFECNVPILIDKGEYTTDFVIEKKDGIAVRECVYRERIGKPMNIELLDASQKYWLEQGVHDWGIVVERAGD